MTTKLDKETITTVSEVLDIIDTFLAEMDHVQSKQLWNILTALRGPDDDNTDTKLKTTSPIRTAALPKTALNSNKCGAIFRAVDELVEPMGGSHFSRHIQYAKKSLAAIGRKIG